MITHQMTFDYLALTLGGKIAKNFTQVPPKFLVQNFPAVLWDENYVVLALPNRMA